MKKIIVLLSVLLATTNLLQAQNLNVKILPSKNFPWSILYELKDVKQIYVDNKQLNKDSTFVFDMSKNTPGMYLLMYDMNAYNYVYFIYNNKPIEFEINTEQNNKIKILKSKENQLFIPYLYQVNKVISELKKIEKKLSEKKQISSKDNIDFIKLKSQLKKLQKKFYNNSKGLLAQKYIQNYAEYFPEIIENSETYFKNKKEHYFDNISFNDKDIQHSNIIIQKINTYIFEIDPPSNPKTKHLEYLKRIDYILPKIKDSLYKNNVIFSLTTSFVHIDGRVSKLLINKYIEKMPESEKKKIDLKSIIDEIGLTINEKAPNFDFFDLQEKKYNLYEISAKKPYTLLIFWSATCPHCLRAMPKIQKIMKNRNDFNVVAIGLESEKYPWSSEHQYYNEFYHGLKLQKWKNPIIKTYHIKATPTFFILNSKNEIIAEPYEVKNIKEFLDNNPLIKK